MGFIIGSINRGRKMLKIIKYIDGILSILFVLENITIKSPQQKRLNYRYYLYHVDVPIL